MWKHLDKITDTWYKKKYNRKKEKHHNSMWWIFFTSFEKKSMLKSLVNGSYKFSAYIHGDSHVFAEPQDQLAMHCIYCT